MRSRLNLSDTIRKKHNGLKLRHLLDNYKM